ncbi:hypothetical protein KBX50_08300 [Micromonospora sp. C51]|uniref:hypothetical protein n=1 Tax=Micromonospora sp. C51 TaxID=2824879 RepID=UPI001B390DC0|nr:hypothetical protein [Micromonospora sp. C51]MBQ1048465.1 hypothetical protein [Micromonospora sp. C51]
MSATRPAPDPNAVPPRPNTGEACYSIASLIDHHRRKARNFITGSEHHRWNLGQTWHYMSIYRSHPGDVAACLSSAADQRRLLAALYAYRRSGVTHIRGSRWVGLKDAILNDAPPRSPLMVVNTGHGGLVEDDSGRGSYPLAVGERFVGEVWSDRDGRWWASRMGPAGTPVGMTTSGSHRHPDAAAYAVGFLVADH